MKKHILNAITGLALATLFLYLTLRDKPLNEILILIREARPDWIFVSVIMLLVVFLFRALRWKLLLKNTGENPGLKEVSYSLLLGIFINSFTPKVGEVVRCTSLQKSTGIDTSKSLGTVISERIYDLLTLLAGIVIILLFELDRLGSLVAGAFKDLFLSLKDNVLMIFLTIAIVIVAIIAIWYLVKKFGVAGKIKEFAKGVASTAKMTFKIKNSRNFAIHTILIWSTMILMNYACLQALPSTESSSLYFAMVALFIGTIGWAIPSPGGIGTSHFFILQLFILFNLSKETGIAYGILVNGLQVLFTIIAGALTVGIVYIVRFIKLSR